MDVTLVGIKPAILRLQAPLILRSAPAVFLFVVAGPGTMDEDLRRNPGTPIFIFSTLYMVLLSDYSTFGLTGFRLD